VLVLATGMGRRRVERALAALEGGPFAAAVSLGTCGALREGLSRGDLVVAERVITEAGDGYGCQAGLVEGALAAARGQGVRTYRGRLLCLERVASEPARKRELGETFGAPAADMESAALAAWAQACGLPFLALKVVSDEAEGWMPPLDGLGWLKDPLGRTLRLPLYLWGIMRTALGWPQVRKGLEGAAGVLAALASECSAGPASGSGAGSR
jgi:hypothetical protein